ncbi:hypothetical protein [Halorubrum sp. CBA1229]|uniref:hypothetical protein n=1 Tax=Halorubrum sp. CBA1229 TaxID=1853699 RepID=UPI000F3F8F62|nr:hypothetical protein [Halorubrum sp. CBA1229]QKY15590.1 hypothetical protein Hrr1229_001350 [Halorubrum sp. CBA1229]
MSGVSLVDVGFQWFIDILSQLIEWFTEAITNGYRDLTEALFGTPVPETSNGLPLGPPENTPWIRIHESLVAGDVTLIAFLILLVCVQGRHTLRIFNLTDPIRSRQVRRSAWTGGILIATWYWVAVIALYLVDGFAILLVPSIGTVATGLADFFTVTISNPPLGFFLTFIGAVAMWTLQALLFLREILLYVATYAMPIAIAVAYSGLPVISNLATRVAVKFIPLAIMPLPVGLLFRGYGLLFPNGPDSLLTPDSAFFRYIIAVSLPVLSVWIIWKLFAYTTPRLVRSVSRVTGLTVTAGAVAGAATVAGPWAGATAARWGPKAAVGHTVAKRVARTETSSDSNADSTSEPTSTAATSSPTVRSHEGGWASYRRTENEPRP